MVPRSALARKDDSVAVAHLVQHRLIRREALAPLETSPALRCGAQATPYLSVRPTDHPMTARLRDGAYSVELHCQASSQLAPRMGAHVLVRTALADDPAQHRTIPVLWRIPRRPMSPRE